MFAIRVSSRMGQLSSFPMKRNSSSSGKEAMASSAIGRGFISLSITTVIFCMLFYLSTKIRLEELRREYILFKKGGVPDDRGIEISPEEWVSQNGPYRFGIRITPHGEKINFPDIASARKWMKEVRTQEGEPDAEFICTGGPIEGYPVSGIYTVYWYIWVFRPGCWKMIHGYLFPIPEGQVMKERGRQQEFIYDSARSYGGNSFAEACDPDSMDYMF